MLAKSWSDGYFIVLIQYFLFCAYNLPDKKQLDYLLTYKAVCISQIATYMYLVLFL